MKVAWLSQSGADHVATLGQADYMLADLQTLKEYMVVFQFIFGEKGSPWLERDLWLSWMNGFRFAMDMEKGLLEYKYGYDGDFHGGEGVSMNGEGYSLDFGIGECSLSQGVSYSKPFAPGVAEAGGRLTKWIDLRGQSELVTDDRTIKISRRKIKLRWPEEVVKIIAFLEDLDDADEVRTQPQ